MEPNARPVLPARTRAVARAVARAWLGGLAATTAMTAALAVEARLQPNVAGPIDYDSSEHVVVAAAKVMRRLPPRSDAGKARLFAVVHWGYGSAVALAYPPIRRRVSNDLGAAAVFWAGCQTMACTLFPLFGGTPPPWRWRRGLLLSSLGVHALYAGVVAVAARDRSAGE